MRESLMYGSVRGARGNSRPYRDMVVCCTALVRSWQCAPKARIISGGGIHPPTDWSRPEGTCFSRVRQSISAPMSLALEVSSPRSSCVQEIAIRQPYDCESQRATSTQTVDKIFLPMNRPRCPHGAIAFVMVQCP